MNRPQAIDEYRARYARWLATLFALFSASVVVAVVSLGVGSTSISFDSVAIAVARRTPIISELVKSIEVSGVEEVIVVEYRLPRVVLGWLVGASLAAAGALFQGIFRNPMADPYVIGVSAGAGLGAAISILLGLSLAPGVSATPVIAFAFALATVYVVYNIARVGSTAPPTTLLLSGIAVSIFLSSIIMFLEVVAGERLHAIVFWLMGGLWAASWSDVYATAPLFLAGLLVSMLYARDLNIMLFGEESASYLGVEVEHVRRVLVAAASLMTAAAVSVSGLIGFVGLIVPHMTRLAVGPDHRVLVPASALVGASLVMSCDAIARVAYAPGELPVGLITALAGAPFFIYLLKRKKGEYAL